MNYDPVRKDARQPSDKVADESSKKIQCLRQGADDYIVKPFNPEELEIRIKNVLNRVRA